MRFRFTQRALIALAALTVVFGVASRSSAAVAASDPWRTIVTPDVSFPPHYLEVQNELRDVTCHREQISCWAVGFYNDPKLDNNEDGLVEHWNGTGWSISGSSVAPAQDSVRLNGVACGNFYSCWAAGTQFTTQTASPYVERWNGSSWQQFPLPTVDGGQLARITCSSFSECWAVGYQGTAAQLYGSPLVLRWDGRTWTTSSFSIPDSDAGHVTGITCVTDDECWAVATDEHNADTTSTTLIERWNGHTWTPTSSPDRAGWAHNDLAGVACVTASNCWAVGDTSNPNTTGGIAMTLIEHWDGFSWTRVGTPTFATGTDFLDAVDCTSASRCFATGYSDSQSGDPSTLIDAWDGHSWSVVQTGLLFTEGPRASSLAAISCRAETCFAAGTKQNNATLIEQLG